MSPLEQEDINYGKSKVRAAFFKKAQIAPGGSETVTITDVEKNHTTKFPIIGENFCYRFILSDERVWDEATGSIFGKVIKFCYPDGKNFTQVTVKVTKLISKPAKGSQYTVEQVKTT